MVLGCRRQASENSRNKNEKNSIFLKIFIANRLKNIILTIYIYSSLNVLRLPTDGTRKGSSIHVKIDSTRKVSWLVLNCFHIAARQSKSKKDLIFIYGGYHK